MKALAELLSRPSNAELLARKPGDLWRTGVDFFIQVVKHSLPEATETQGRAGTSFSSRNVGGRQSQKSEGQGDGPLTSALSGLLFLSQVANAPTISRSQVITDTVIAVLQARHLSLGSLQTACFSIINVIFTRTRLDDMTYAIDLARYTLPLTSFWWRADKVSQDESIRSLRNEISRTIILMHLHYEHLALNLSEAEVHDDLEELADNLWLEYNRRSEPFRLQLSDITFDCTHLPPVSFRLELYGLSRHNVDGESSWALLENLARIEAILQRWSERKRAEAAEEEPEQPRKRRRVVQGAGRVMLNLQSPDLKTRRTAVQLVPFLLELKAMRLEELIGLLNELANLSGNKDGIIASWALIACAR